MSSSDPANNSRRAAALREIRKVLPLIRQVKNEKQERNWSGTTTCPICHQRLYLYHFGGEGKTWGRCVTKDCIAWLISLFLVVFKAFPLLRIIPDT